MWQNVLHDVDNVKRLPIDDSVEEKFAIEEVRSGEFRPFYVQQVRVVAVEQVGHTCAVVVPVSASIVVAIGLVDQAEKLCSWCRQHYPRDQLRGYFLAERCVVDAEGVETVDDDDVSVKVDASARHHQFEFGDVTRVIDAAELLAEDPRGGTAMKDAERDSSPQPLPPLALRFPVAVEEDEVRTLDAVDAEDADEVEEREIAASDIKPDVMNDVRNNKGMLHPYTAH